MTPAFATVRSTFAVSFPAVTVIVAFPTFFAVTLPFASTVATAVLLLVNLAASVIPLFVTLIVVVFPVVPPA